MKYQTFLVIFTIVTGISLHSQANSIFAEGFTSKDSTEAEKSKKIVKLHIRPSLGLTFGDSNSEGERISNLQWLATVNSDFTYISKGFDLSSTLFMQYGQSKAEGQDPVKLQDAFVLSVTPSISLIKLPPIRLFLETTAETNLGKGFIDENPTSFLDPLFLYQTRFNW